MNYWEFIAGLGLFLYGMSRIEDSLRELAGKRFKLFLRDHTTNRFLAIINGAFATAVLQSSTIVMLMIIAFAGAGILSLSNSLGIILGANLGTTFTGWVVSFLGFSFKFNTLIYPLIGIGSLGVAFTSKQKNLFHVFSFLIALGLILMGLGFMREGMTQLSTVVEVEQLQQYGLGAFFLFGLIVTAIIQSSSAMMMITLSALYANVITLLPAAFIVIGADLGTTTTALVASMRGSPAKKRVALAHLLFNITSAISAALLVKFFLLFITDILNIKNPLYTLVAFHSLMNFVAILLFLPFLGAFEKLLNKFFINSHDHVCQFIHKVGAEVPDVAIEAVRLELRLFIQNVFKFNAKWVGVYKHDDVTATRSYDFLLLKSLLATKDDFGDYENLKRTEEELLDYFIAIQKEILDEKESVALNQYIVTLRNGVQSAKAIKDIQHNLVDFSRSVSNDVERYLNEIKMHYTPYFKLADGVLRTNNKTTINEDLVRANEINNAAYQHLNEWIYSRPHREHDDSVSTATLLNMNREIHTANQFLLEAMRDVLPPALSKGL